MQLSTRISCFVSIWILTNDVGDRSVSCGIGILVVHVLTTSRSFQHVLTSSGNFLWTTLSAALICILSLAFVMSLLHWRPTNFERDIASTLDIVHRSLELGLSLAFPHPGEPPVDRGEYERLKRELLRRSVTLNENYSQAAFELRIGRLSCE